MTRSDIIAHIEHNTNASNYNELQFCTFDKLRPYLKTAHVVLTSDGDHSPCLLIDHVTNCGGLAAIVSSDTFTYILDQLNEGDEDEKDLADLINFQSLTIARFVSH